MEPGKSFMAKYIIISISLIAGLCIIIRGGVADSVEGETVTVLFTGDVGGKLEPVG